MDRGQAQDLPLKAAVALPEADQPPNHPQSLQSCRLLELRFAQQHVSCGTQRDQSETSVQQRQDLDPAQLGERPRRL